MRKRADVQRAIRHLEEAKKGAHLSGNHGHEAYIASVIDVLKWTTGDDSTPFTKLVMEPCDQVDRAGRQ